MAGARYICAGDCSLMLRGPRDKAGGGGGFYGERCCEGVCNPPSFFFCDGLGGALARRAHAGHVFFFYHSPLMPVFAPTSTNNLEYRLAVSKNLAPALHPVYDDGKGGGWKWWEWHFVLLNSHISAYTRCLAEKVCGLVRSTWVTSQGEDKLGARDNILNTKVARCARATQTFPLGFYAN